jgi:hypothetical protein
MESTRPVKKIRLIVGESFNVPDVYASGTPAEIEEALWIGASVQAAVTGRRGDDAVKRITDAHERELGTIRSRYMELEASLRQAQEAASRAAAEAASETRKVERAAAEKELALIQTRCDALEARRRELEASREADIKAATDRCQALMEKVIQAKEEQISRMEAAHSRLQDGLTKHSEELVRLSAAVQKKSVGSANVKTKGTEYEAEFREKLIRAYGLSRGFTLKETRLGGGHEMDFIMTTEGGTVMWELKDYSAAVPKSEVEKFIRDLRGNADARIGVMISRLTDITGKSGAGDFSVEFEDDKLMIYIGRFEVWAGGLAEEIQVFQTLAALFKVWWTVKRDDEATAAAPTINREELIKELERQQADVAKRRTEWRTHKSRVDDMLRWTADFLEEAEGRLDRLLRSIRSGGAGAGSGTPVPAGIFRDADDEKSRQWIQSILTVTTAASTTIELRDIVDRLADIHKLSKDTIRSHVKSVLLDSSIERGKGGISLVRGLSLI